MGLPKQVRLEVDEGKWISICFKLDARPIKKVTLADIRVFTSIWEKVAKTVNQLHGTEKLIQGGLSLDHIVWT